MGISVKRKYTGRGLGGPAKRRRIGPYTRPQIGLGVENKFYDTVQTNTALVAPTDAAGGEVDPDTLLTLSAMAQGDGESTRDGRKCTIISIQVKGVIKEDVLSDQADMPNYQRYFLALVQDTQTNGAQLDSEKVFINPAAATSLAAAPLRNLQYEKRFKVLWQKSFQRQMKTSFNDGGATASVSGSITPFAIYKKVKIPVLFSAITAGITSVTDNSLHLIAYAMTTAGAPTIAYNCRLRFVG